LTFKVAVIDYGAGNLGSVLHAISYLGGEAEIIRDPDRLKGFSHMVLPGVGSFHSSINLIRSRGLDQALFEQIEHGVPLLGICLGMQILADRGSEGGESKGMGLISGDVDRFDFDIATSNLKIPHVGFDVVKPKRNSKLFAGFGETADFYFTHSFRLRCASAHAVAADAWHGEPYVAAVEQGLVAGTQFHPEKSQHNGLRLMLNFLERF